MRFTLNPFTHRLDAFEQDTPGFSDIETITPVVGGAVGPDAGHNINLIGGPGFITINDGTPNTVILQPTEYLEAAVITNDATPTACITFDLGLLPAVYTVRGMISGLNTTDTAGGGYLFSGCVRTDGLAATLIAVDYSSDFEEVAMEDSDVDMIVSGNDLIVQVTGIAAKEIHWNTTLKYSIAV